jgi:hypothetical protein
MSNKENNSVKDDFAESNKSFTADVAKLFEELPNANPKRNFEEMSQSGQSTGSYCAKIEKVPKFDIKKFKMVKTGKQAIDLSTEEGKYQKKQEELAKQRKTCTEICFNNYSDVREFKENFKVFYIN